MSLDRPVRVGRSSGPVEEVDWDEDAAEKGGYETFMLKEIHEQPTPWPTPWPSASPTTAPVSWRAWV